QAFPAGKPEDSGGDLLALPEPRLAVVGAERGDFHGLGTEQVAHRVDAIDPDIVERPSAQLARVEPDVAFLDLHGEDRVEQPRLPEAPSLDQFYRLEAGFLEVEP